MHDHPLAATSVSDFFRPLVSSAFDSRPHLIGQHVIADYVTGLMERFSRTEKTVLRPIKPDEARRVIFEYSLGVYEALQFIGDSYLFTTGFFPESVFSLETTPRTCRELGRFAYDRASRLSPLDAYPPKRDIFGILAEYFPSIEESLSDVRRGLELVDWKNLFKPISHPVAN